MVIAKPAERPGELRVRLLAAQLPLLVEVLVDYFATVEDALRTAGDKASVEPGYIEFHRQEQANAERLLTAARAAQEDGPFDVVHGAELFEVVGATNALLVCIQECASSVCERFAADVDSLRQSTGDTGEDIQAQLQLVNAWVMTLLAVREHQSDE